MSRLRAFGIIVAVLFVNISFFPLSEKAVAQSIDRQQELNRIGNNSGNYDYYQGQVNAYFQAANAALDQVAARDQSQIEPTNRFKTYLATINNAYTTTFNNEKARGTPAVDAQLEAIRAFNAARTSSSNLQPIANYSASAPQRSAISQLSVKMNDAFTAATQIKNGTISAGSPEADVLTGGATTINNATQGNTNTTTKTSEDSSTKCSLLGSSPIINCLDAGLTWLIKNTLLQIAGFLVWVTANMFNYSVQIGVLNFKDWAPDTLYPIWVIIRQIVSLLIVFAGLYLGLLYIIGNKDDNKFEKYIPWVIIFALFVNFSYPLARTAIDISNIVSLNIYSSAVGNEALTSGLTSRNTAGALIMERLGLQDLVFSATKTAESNNMLSGVNSVPGALLAVIFVFYAAYIFFMVTAIMVVRTVSLVFITIASPLLLVDSVLPLLGDKAQQLRKIFFEQLAVGPVFMIMLALTLKFLEVFSRGPVNLGAAGANNASTITTFFNILMMLIMLHIMIKVTKLTAGSLGQYATDAMGKVGGFGLGVAAGGAGLLARKGIGGLAAKARDSKWVTNNQDSFLGRRAYDMSNSLAKSTFDLRNSKVVAGRMERVGMGMGMGSKLGYEAEAQAKRMDLVDRGSRIKTRYERDVVDPKTGEVLHKKGDIDVEGSRAQERFVANGGGALFMGKEQRQLTREAIGEKVNEENKKRIETIQSNAKPDLDLYNKGTKEEKATLKAELQKELEAAVEKIKEANPALKELDIKDPKDIEKMSHLMGDQAQSIVETLKKINEKEKAESDALKKQIESLVFKHENMKGKDDADIQQKRKDLVNSMDKDTREAFTKAQTEMLSAAQAAKITQVGAQAQAVMANKPVNDATGATPVDIDLTQKSTQTLAAERRVEKQAAAMDVINKSFKDQIKQRQPTGTPPIAPAPVPGKQVPPKPTSAPVSSNQSKFVSGNTKDSDQPLAA